MLKVSPRKGVIHFGKRGKLNPRYIGPFKILEQISLVAYKLELLEELMEIMDREIKQLRQSRIPIIKVRWNSKRGPEFTWEREDEIRAKYPYTNGQIKVLPPKIAEEILARERERKAKTTLLMSIPEDHLAKFHRMTDAKEIWEAIKSRFGGNDESKKMQKYNLKQQFESFSVSNSEGLHKGYDRFQNLLSQLEIRGAGVSTEDANQKFFSSTNDVSTAYGVSASSGHNSKRENSLSYTDELINRLEMASSHDLHEIEEVLQKDKDKATIKMESRFQEERCREHWYKAKDNGRRPGKQEEPKALVTLNGDGSDTEREQLGDAGIEIKAYTLALEKVEAQLVCHQKNQLAYEEKIRFMKIDLDDKSDVLTYHKKLLAEAIKEKEELKTKLENFQSSSKNLSKLLNSQMSAKDKFRLGYGNQIYEGVLSYENEVFQSVFDSRSSDVEESPVNDRFANVEGMDVVPPPMTRIYIPPKFDFGIDESYIETLESVPKPVVNEPKVVSEPKVWSDAPIIEEYESDSDDEYMIQPSKEQNKPSFAFVNIVKHVKTSRETGKGTSQGESRPVWNNVQRLNHQNKFVPTTVLTRTGRFLVNAARQNLSSQATSTSAAKKVNTARPIVNETRPRNNFYKSHSPTKRPFNKTTAPKANFLNHKVTTAGDKAVSVVGGNRKTAVKTSVGCNWRLKRQYWNKVSKYNSGSHSSKNDDPQRTLKNKGIVNSGCSRYMTGNKAYLVEYQDYNGGPIAFGGSKGYITSKDTECLVLSPDFKLLDENQVLLRVPRKNNMYSFNLENIVPTGGLACLIAKATVDESNKWHRRSKGIKREYNNARTSQQNGVAERKNRTLIKAARTMLADSFLPNTFWAEAVSIACYVLNRRIKLTKPQVHKKLIIVQSSEAKNGGEKLKNDTAKALRKEFSQNTKDLLLQAGAAITTSTNTVNTVSTPGSTASPSRVFSAGESSYPDSTNSADQDDSQIPALEDIYDYPSNGIFTNASYDDEGAVADFINLETTVNVSPIPTSRIHSIHPTTQILGDQTLVVQKRSKVNKTSRAHTLIEPKKIFEALKEESWVDAMQEELNKKDERGVVVRNKARLVAQGYRQKEGIDYDEFPKKVYKVIKALYGLHQASRAWYATLSTFLEKSRYRRGTIDKTLFIKKDKKGIMLVQVYVDDIIFGSIKKSWCDEFEALMKSRFQMSSMGELTELTFFLGLQDEEAADVDVHIYRSMIGSLMYLTASTPDIMYLKGKLKLGLWFPRVSLFDLEAYSDTTSTTEAEYVAASNCCGQVLWIQNQMLDY
ncbi:ribonuclease H-like domain-containing protein, partial [Tanacetum coccineum]